ncbi:hypothetical protein [Butyrivibrio sp. AC2005]|nr:hypothetical protein [Butyrivibrio sp. AC2005]
MKNKFQSAYPFPLNLYRELCLEMGLPMPDTMSEDEKKPNVHSGLH